MANIKSSEIDIRKIKKRNIANSRKRAELRTAYKNLVKSIESGQKDEAQESFRQYTKLVDTVARKGLIKQNKAARHKSRFAQRINKLN